MLTVSPFIGTQIDKGNAKRMLYITVISLILFNICFYQINAAPWPLAIMGLITWGIQRTGAQIVFSALVFHSIPNSTYCTGIGLFYLTSGFATMLSSFICGYLADHCFSLVFLFSGAFAILALGVSWVILTQTMHTRNAYNV